MSDMKDLDINAIVERIQDASELSYSYYKALVDRIIAEKASEKEVEHLLDYMFDVCHDDRMLNLFKKVCRRYYSLYPEMIASEILTYKEYMKFSKLAREIYGRYTDQIEPYGMDECWLDVTGSGCMGTGFEIADEIRRTVKFELGLTISAGVSFNKIFAKLGSDMKKPDAITCIEADSFQEKIWCLPASDLLGVGRATEKVLSGYGIHTIGELAATSDDFLKCRLGKNGLAIKKYANGLDDSPVMRSDYVSPVKSIGHGITTMQDLENNAEVWCVMLELVQEIGTKLRAHKKKAGGIAISIRNNELYTKEWQCRIGIPTQSPTYLAKTAFALFAKNYQWEHPIRSVTVRAINLFEEDCPIQYDLFTDVKSLDRQERLDAAIEQIRFRFGKDAIKNGVLFQKSKMPTERKVDLVMPTGMIG